MANSESASRPTWRRHAVLALAILWFGTLLYKLIAQQNFFFWDFRIYYYAAQRLLQGGNPYAADIIPAGQHVFTRLYIYPPVSLGFFVPFALLDQSSAFVMMLLLKTALLLGLAWLWQKKFWLGHDEPWLYLFLILGFIGTTELDLRAGNVSIYEQALLWAGLHCFLKQRPKAFGAFICLAAVFKLTPLFFLVLFLFSKDQRRFFWFSVFSGIAALSLVIQYLVVPDMVTGFLRNMTPVFYEQGLISPSTFTLAREALLKMGNIFQIRIPDPMVLAGYFALLGGLAYFSRSTFLQLLKLEGEERRLYLVFFAVVSYVLLMPRFKDYSFTILIPPAYFLMRRIRFDSGFPVLFLLFCLIPGWRLNDTSAGFDGIFWFLHEFYQLWLALAVWWFLRVAINQRATGAQHPWISFKNLQNGVIS